MMPHPPQDARRRCLKLHEWPAIDRGLWETALRSGADLDDDAYAASLRPTTLAKAQEGYGRWLGFLDHAGELDAAVAPSTRVTRARVAAFFKLMRALGNRSHTVVGRLVELQSALRIMEPARDFGWLTRPNGRSIRGYLPMAKRSPRLRGSDTLYRWGLRMMDEASGRSGPRRRQVQFRDGLLIAIFASRAFRLRSMSELRLGQQVVGDGGRYRVILDEPDVKTEKAQECFLPDSLTPYMNRYLTVERLELLNGHTTDWLWVNWGGGRLDYRGIDKRVRWCSQQEFGEAFGPHRFRHEMGTTGPMMDPANPGIAAAIMGITAGIHEKHYNLGKRIEAANRFHAALRRERRSTEGMARRLFTGDR